MAASGEAPQVAAAASPLPAPAVAHADDGSLHEVPLDAAPPIDVRDADARAQAAPAGEAAAEAQPQGANERGVWATLKWFGRGVWWTGEFIGEVVADFIGITDSKYQYVIDAYERHLYQLKLEKEERRRLRRERRAQEDASEAAIEAAAGAKAPAGLQRAAEQQDAAAPQAPQVAEQPQAPAPQVEL